MTLTINTKNQRKLRRIKDFLKEIEVDFNETESVYDEEFVKKIEKSREEIKKGETKKIALEDLWK